jgi:hypothetical protein
MAHEVRYVATEQTARMTPDAFRVRLEQSGFAMREANADDEQVELEMDGATLWLLVEDGFVVEVDTEVTFVNDRKSAKLLELIESMGWVPEDALE